MTSDTKTEVLSGDLVDEFKKTNGVTKRNGITNDCVKNIENGTLRAGIQLPKDIGTDYNFKRKIVWPNAIGFAALHLAALYSITVFFRSDFHFYTLLWGMVVLAVGGQGITMGAHRLFSHKTFKAKLVVRVALIILQTVAGQNCLYVWARDHRLHHKYSDTDADPHNSNRGFFFSHIGWLMSRKHPAVFSKGKTIDMSDLEADPLVMFQKKYYKSCYLVFSIAFPVSVPVYFWNETYLNSFFVAFILRSVLLLHFTWSVNSVAHMFGTKPYDKTMRPVESMFVAIVSTGEGWHNYHHAFPWDYRASELGMGAHYNFTTMLIDLLAYFGLAYDLRAAQQHMVEHRALKSGDGTHAKYGPMKIAKDAATKNEEDREHQETEQEDSLETEITSDNISSLPKNEILKSCLNKEECHKEIFDTILVKDSGTGETTCVQRIVKDKHLLHG